jgi:hypothetical protein
MSVVKPEGKRPLLSPSYGLWNNTNLNIRKTGCQCVEWNHVAQDKEQQRSLASAIMNEGFYILVCEAV